MSGMTKRKLILVLILVFCLLGIKNSYAAGLSKTVEVAIVKVEFTNAAGAPLTSPHRIGITVGTHNRTQHLRAVVSPPDFTITGGPRITLSNVVRIGNVFTFDIVGTGKSITSGDTKIIATHTSGLTFDHPVSVVVPSSIGTPHPQPSGEVAAVNRVLDATTSPLIPGLPAGQVALVTSYLQWLSIRVVDQFGDNIGDLYEGATVNEGGFPLNQNLQANSTYQDPIGFAYPAAIVPAGSAEATAWPAAGVLPMDPAAALLNVPVDIDGFALNPTSDRRITATPPSTITINWP